MIRERFEESRADVAREIVESGAYKRAPVGGPKFKLKSGRESDHYVDLRRFFGSANALHRVGLLIADEFLVFNALSGPATAAVPLISAAGILAGEDVKLTWVRSEAKEHGTRSLIEGAELGESDEVLLIDDVLTSGGSLIRVAELIRATGAHVSSACVVVDRLEGGKEALRAVGIELHAIVGLPDLERCL